MSSENKPKLVFFGNERIATGITTTAPTLLALIDAGYEIAAVVANETQGQPGRLARGLEIAGIANEHGIPLLLPKKLKEIKPQLEKFGAGAGILVAFGRIVPEEIINIFPGGIINIHPSLLPLHRGPIPIESVILEGAKSTGVSLMRLVRSMDAGPVYAQKAVALSGDETKQHLADKLLSLGSEMLVESLPTIISGELAPNPQDDADATYDRLLTKDDGVIDWSKPAAQIEREIRAYANWPKSHTSLSGKEILITKAHVSDEQETGSGKQEAGKFFVATNKELAVQTGDGYLIIDQLKPAGKTEMAAQAFLAGYGHLLN